ncbi:sensor histidine kinase [Egicoccus sp. AB-alg2]|uniref:sensor histidine kinase n=1 Tax=Egicoccus sp. AB-alg2 TaxID=3242693 RepID=UPI00359DE12B
MGADRALRRALESVVKLVLNARLFSLLLTLLWLPFSDPAGRGVVTGLLVLVLATSALPLLRWDRLGGWILEHPAWLLVDLCAAVAVLGLVGLETPFVLWLLATALVSGILYGWRGALPMSAAIVAVYLAGAMLGETRPTLVEVLGTPALVPVAAFGGAAVRELLLRQHAAGRALAESAMTEAAGSERTRLAREMHDTLAKTLHGIGLTATAVAELARQDPDAAVTTARTLAATAQRAAAEARALIGDLRVDDLDRPLPATLREATERWSRQTGVRVHLDTQPCAGLSPSARYELFCIVREALRNAHEHGQAREVRLSLRDGELVELTIVDDGHGFRVPDHLDMLADEQHFGVIGMRERAEQVGGSLTVSSTPGHGTRVQARVPRGVDGRPALAPTGIARPSDDLEPSP